jgi:hypothetical protein
MMKRGRRGAGNSMTGSVTRPLAYSKSDRHSASAARLRALQHALFVAESLPIFLRCDLEASHQSIDSEPKNRPRQGSQNGRRSVDPAQSTPLSRPHVQDTQRGDPAHVQALHLMARHAPCRPRSSHHAGRALRRAHHLDFRQRGHGLSGGRCRSPHHGRHSSRNSRARSSTALGARLGLGPEDVRHGYRGRLSLPPGTACCVTPCAHTQNERQGCESMDRRALRLRVNGPRSID